MIISHFPSDGDIALNVKEKLADNTWWTISKVATKGQGENYWAIGDTKEIVINGMVGSTNYDNISAWAFIIGFNHNSDVEGYGKIHFQIGKNAQVGGKNVCFVDSKYGQYVAPNAGYFSMFATNTNNGGWESSQMRTTVLGSNYTPTAPSTGTMLAAFPSDLRKVMKSVTKYSDNIGGANTATNVTKTTDYLWLLAEYEVYGTRSKANTAEQKNQRQYAYYANGNTKLFYKDSDVNTAAIYWLRSTSAGSSNAFCSVNNNGAVVDYYAHTAYGVAPAFCV